MITREPIPGDKLQCKYRMPTMETVDWYDKGTVVLVDGDICYFNDITSIRQAVPNTYPEGANNCFIWRFKDRLNNLFRIAEASVAQ